MSYGWLPHMLKITQICTIFILISVIKIHRCSPDGAEIGLQVKVLLAHQVSAFKFENTVFPTYLCRHCQCIKEIVTNPMNIGRLETTTGCKKENQSAPPKGELF